MSLRYFIFIDLLLLLGHQTVTGQSALDMGTTPVYNLDQTREDFKDFYAFHIGLPDEYILTFVDDLGVKRKVKLKALSMKEIDANRKRKEALPRHGNLALQILNESTAVLRVAAFSDWNHFGKKIKFSKELKRLFFKIDSSKISNLIIDVRDNGGGADQLGLLLFSRFYGDPIIEFNAMHHRLKKSKYTEYSDISNVQIGVMKFLLRSKKIDDSIFAFQGFKTLKPHGPSKPIFNGEVYLLINGRSYSTAVDFAALMKSYGVATFIGEETGGGYYGNTSWLPINVVLPNTKIRMKIPTVRYTTHVKPLFPIGRGVIPDHRIVPSISDEIKGIDTEMNFALQTIKKNE